jgi:hypothetical protein
MLPKGLQRTLSMSIELKTGVFEEQRLSIVGRSFDTDI